MYLAYFLGKADQALVAIQPVVSIVDEVDLILTASAVPNAFRFIVRWIDG